MSQTQERAEQTNLLNVQHKWVAGQGGTPYSLADASTVVVDMSLGNNFELVTTSSVGSTRTLGVPLSAIAGQSGVISCWQSETGNNALAYAWCWQSPSGTLPSLSTGIFELDELVYYVTRSSTLALTSISNASPAVFTLVGHGLMSGSIIQLTTSGALPTGLSLGTTYWVHVINGSTFNVSTSLVNLQAATFVNTSTAGSGTHTFQNLQVTLTTNSSIS